MKTNQPAVTTATPTIADVEILDSAQLAQRLNVPESWIREHVRERSADKIPHLRLGRYRRFVWASPELTTWIDAHLYRPAVKKSQGVRA